MCNKQSSISLESHPLHLLTANANFMIVGELVEIIVSDHGGGSLATNGLRALAASL